MSEQDREAGLKGLLAALGRSAEYSIALGLVVVCAVVGGALWFIDSGHKTAAAAADPAVAKAPTAVAEAEEKAALEDWKRQLQGDFKQIEQQQKKAADDAASRERQRQEAERNERAAAERERRAREEAAATAVAAERQRQAQQAARAVPVIAAPRAVVRTEPAIDWSSCRRPEYPRRSVERREEGVVTVGLDLDSSGKVLDSRIAESSGHKQLDLVAQRAIAQCEFRPATVDGVARAASAHVRFAWKLQN